MDMTATQTNIRLQEGARSFEEYLQRLVHMWARTLVVLGIALIPIFFIVDFFIIPQQLLGRFAVYRLMATAVIIVQYILLTRSHSSRYSFLHGFFFSFVASTMICIMITEMDGFNTPYYAGLNLVQMGANLLLPWKPVHSGINSAMVVLMYVLLNLLLPGNAEVNMALLINNMFFLISSAIISVSINYVRYRLIRQEFHARQDLKLARDALWSEVEVARRIQASLLPMVHYLPGYDVGACMIPTAEVGGDYYDIIKSESGENWVSIGDVSGHGVESGLIMMMTQTSLYSVVNDRADLSPSAVLTKVNSIIFDNIVRLGSDRYMSITAMKLHKDHVTIAGKHQDVLVYRRQTGKVESVPTTGTWIGIVKELSGYLEDTTIPIARGDIILLYTDGVTEARNEHDQMYAEQNLKHVLAEYAHLEVDQLVTRIIQDVTAYMATQDDDITVMVLKRD